MFCLLFAKLFIVIITVDSTLQMVPYTHWQKAILSNIDKHDMYFFKQISQHCPHVFWIVVASCVEWSKMTDGHSSGQSPKFNVDLWHLYWIPKLAKPL